MAEAQRAGAAVGRWLGPARLSPQPAPLPTRAAPHGPAAAAAVRRSCPGSPEPEVRHDGSGAEDSGAGGVRENGSGTGPGSGTVRGPPLGRGRRAFGTAEGLGAPTGAALLPASGPCPPEPSSAAPGAPPPGLRSVCGLWGQWGRYGGDVGVEGAAGGYRADIGEYAALGRDVVR